LRTSCADTALRLLVRTMAITIEPRLVSAQLGTQRSPEIVNQRFPREYGLYQVILAVAAIAQHADIVPLMGRRVPTV